jgi:glutathione S-transferase
MMKLFNAMLSPFAARCRIQIYAKGLDVEFAEAWGEFSREELVKKNPMTKVPVFEDGDLVLPESETICEYLEDRFPDPSLRPENIEDRARMRLLSRVVDFYVFESMTPLFAHLSRKTRDQEIVDRQLKALDKGLRTLEHFISKEGFAVGPTLTLADCALVPILLFVVTYLPFFAIEEPLGPYPRLAAYWKRVEQQEHAARVIEEMREAMKAKALAAKKQKLEASNSG